MPSELGLRPKHISQLRSLTDVTVSINGEFNLPPVSKLLHLLHVLNKFLVLSEIHFVIFGGYLALRFEESLGKLEIILLYLLNLSLSNNQIQRFRAERHE